MRLCADARWGTKHPHQDRQNESGDGHCRGASMKQCHAEERKAEDYKFHGSPKMLPAETVMLLR
jgi:hypothetical protein